MCCLQEAAVSRRSASATLGLVSAWAACLDAAGPAHALIGFGSKKDPNEEYKENTVNTDAACRAGES